MILQRRVPGGGGLARRALVGAPVVGGALLEAGVYLSWSPERTAALMAAPEQGRATLARLLAERVAGLAQLPTREPIAAGAVERAVERALEQRAGLQPTPDDWSAHERAARETAAPGYAALQNHQ